MANVFEVKKKVTCKNLYREDTYNLILLRRGFMSAVVNGEEVSFPGPCVVMLREGLTVEGISAYRHDKEVVRFDVGYIEPSADFETVNSGKYASICEELGLPPLDMFVKSEGKYKYYVPLDEKEYEVVNAYFEKAITAETAEGAHEAGIAKANFCLLLEYLYRLYKRYTAESHKTSNIRDPEVFMDIILGTIYRDYGRKISLITLAADVGINKTTVAKVFRQTTGMPMSDYIIRYRIRCANYALSATKLTIRDICALCGFNSEAYFVKQYGKRTGTTPAVYRRNAARLKSEQLVK